MSEIIKFPEKEKEISKFPEWEKDKPEESLDAIYDWAVCAATNNVEWYERKKKPRRLWSQSLRALSIIFAAAGALCPLIDATGVTGGELILARWGYVFLAVAASVAGFDYYFGHSSGWMRFIVTQISIERALKEFQYDWVILKVQQENNPSSTPIFLQRAKDFTLQIENIIKQETDAWVTEFQTNITQLEKVLKTETEARKPGSIKVSIKNCSDFERVQIRLNDNPVKELNGVSEGIINTVAPGHYEVTVIGKKDGKEHKASKVIEVQAGTLVRAEFTLSNQQT
ncbi:MAG: SLATT domain-containing protein [Acidobacteriota bacterium]|nr:SLATT domain-containing protein [Acidobacteriota bacterium]